MAASLRSIDKWKILAKYNNFSLIVSPLTRRSTSSSSGEDPPSTSNVDLEEIDNIIKERNKDMPIPDMTNPFERQRHVCILCKYDVHLDYKNAKLLSQFVSPVTGKIYSKHLTKLCSEQYDRLDKCIRMSRQAGYMPYMYKDVDFVHDPKLFDVNTR